MKRIIVLLLTGYCFLAFSQESVTRSISSFSGIKVAEGIDVYLKKGEKESLRLEVSGVNPGNVITEVSGDYLKVHLADTRRLHNYTVKVYVTYVDLSKLSASSAANIFSDGVIKSKDLTINSSSAASVDIDVDVSGTVEVSASSAADVELKGKVGRLKVSASSAGEVDAYDLEAEIVEVEASSAGSAKVFATKEIEARASSGGSIRFRGNPSRQNTNSSSGGTVKKSS